MKTIISKQIEAMIDTAVKNVIKEIETWATNYSSPSGKEKCLEDLLTKLKEL